MVDVPQCPVCGSYAVDQEADYWYCEDCMYHWPVDHNEDDSNG